MSRTWKWVGAATLALTLLSVAAVAVLATHGLRPAIAYVVTERTGRALAIDGELAWKLEWPLVRVHAGDVRFANPPWAREPQMLAAADIDLTVDLPQLLRGKLYLPDVALGRPVVVFEHGADGRRNWLLDKAQTDDGARALIGRVTLDRGRITYDETALDTSLVADVSSSPATAGSAAPGIEFKATGKYRGLPLAATGSGGAVIAMGDEATPYPFVVDATIGPTGVKADGTITGLVDVAAADVTLALRGGSLDELYALLDLPLPATHAYRLAGRLTHTTNEWTFGKFSGRIGRSDVTGSLQFKSGDARPRIDGELAFKSLDLDDLGPVVGANGDAPAPAAAVRGAKVAAKPALRGARGLPARPFRRDRWTTFDAEVKLTAQAIIRPKALPLENLTTRLVMRDSVLTLDPLDFGAAGGDLVGVVTLDGQHDPIRAHAKLTARKLLLARLLPTVPLAQKSVGQISGDIELAGRGDSVAKMLATADGKIGLVVVDGKTSKLLMEEIALHLPEIVLQHVTGDKLIDIRCGVAEFEVDDGVMAVRTLVLDTDVTKVVGSGSVDLAQQTLDLKLVPRPKQFSVFALRGPVYVRGTLDAPKVSLDITRVAVRGLAAAALAAINPALALIPLADPGSGKDSDCDALTRRARAPWRPAAPTAGASASRATAVN